MSGMTYNICILGNTGKNIKSAYSWFVKTIHEGLKLNGHNVYGFDYKSHSIDEIKDFLFSRNPNILFTHLTMHKHHDKFEMMELFDTLRNLYDTKVIHTMQDARSEPRYDGDISHAFDLALVAQKRNIEKFQNCWNIPVYYWPYSSLTYDKMGKYRKELDFGMPVFPGNPNSHPDRSDFIRKLKNIMNIKVIQTQSAEDIRGKTLDFSASTDCVLGLCTGYDKKIWGYNEVRFWQFLGAGAIMVARDYDCNKYIFPEGLYFGFDSYNDPSVVKEYWQKINNMSEEKKNKMRENAFNFIQKYHSSKVRMSQTIELIEGKRNKLDIFL